ILITRHTTRQICQFRVRAATPRSSVLCHFVPKLRLRLRDLPLLFSNASIVSSHLSAVSPMMASHMRSHTGHHHHHHDNVYLVSQNKNDAGVRITRIGLLVNLAMAIGKFIGGYVFHSQALIADAYHALTDLVSDFMTLGTVAWSLKPPSERFPNGYGKVES